MELGNELPAPAAVTERPTAAGAPGAKGWRRVLVEQAGILVGEVFQFDPRDFLADKMLDGGDSPAHPPRS